VFDLRGKLDAAGFYDDFEVDRVVAVELNPKAKQSELAGALEPVLSRILRRYKAAQEQLKVAKARNDTKGAEVAQNEMSALTLFKADLGAFQRTYAFLAQIFDYGNTDIEKRYWFFKRLLPLLEFGREREEIDLSKVVLTHHHLKNLGKRNLPLDNNGEYPKLDPLGETGSGMVQEKEKALLYEIIAKVNDLFQGELSDDDKLVYVNNVLKGKLMESDILVQQATNSTKQQFSDSPDLAKEIMNAVMDALAAHSTMSKQALDSERVRDGLKDVLLGPAQLYEALRQQGAQNKAL
jgi:type I restriction enzyme R subunit